MNKAAECAPLEVVDDVPAPGAPPSLNFPVVGIGASAGGVAALLRFFEHLPRNTGMAYVVILHLSPKHESHADHILQNVAAIPVLQVTETVKIEPDHAYVISPARQLEMFDGQLYVSPQARTRGRPTASTCSSAPLPKFTVSVPSAWCFRAPVPTARWAWRASRNSAA